jgi:hypothetical protein
MEIGTQDNKNSMQEAVEQIAQIFVDLILMTHKDGDPL